MALPAPLLSTSFPGLSPVRAGKVRDLYDAGDDLLIVATDRISAFDYVLGSGIPDKGKVLNQLSAFWFDLTKDVVKNHVRLTNPDDFPPSLRAHADVLRGRSMLVCRTNVVPIECVVRGYLVGFRLGRVPARAAPSAASRCPRACAKRTGCPSRSSRRPRRRKRGTTSTSRRTRPAASWGAI